MFFPRFYYSWFYVDERTLYNITCLKQRLGPNINQKDVDAYNQMRQQMIPVSPFKLKKTRQTGHLDDNKIVFDDLKLVRKNGIMLFLASLSVGLYARNILKMSPLWYISAF